MKAFILPLILLSSFTASADLLKFNTRLNNPNSGITIGPTFDGKGQRIFMDSTRWDLQTKGKVQIFTDKKSRPTSKLVVEFNKKKEVSSVADISELEIEYENKNRRVKCRLDGKYTQVCDIYTIKNCSSINSSFQREFQGDFKKIAACEQKLHNLSLSSNFDFDSKMLPSEVKNEILKYKEIVDDSRMLRSMDLKNARIGNTRLQGSDTDRDRVSYGSEVSRSGSHIFNQLRFCEDRGLLGKDKAPFVKKEAPKEKGTKSSVKK